MKQPIPSYLIALAVGDLRFQALGDRTGVWTEPSRLAAAAHEFADLPRMLEAGEQMAGPYRWDRYDLLVMPRAFAFGGMENPRLSFISPSTVAGDRSLVTVIVHELAHSWSGNLVTNSTWDDFWLNEGFTSLSRAPPGRNALRRASRPAWRTPSPTRSWCRRSRTSTADGQPADSALHLELAGRNPDEGMSDVAYQKGRWFLGFLEERFGRPAFDAFLREYFDAHAFQSIDTTTFRSWLLDYLKRPGAPAVTAVEIDEWIYRPGLPATMPKVAEGVFAPVDRIAADWRAGRIATDALPVKDWIPQEWVRFLDEQPSDLEDAKLAELRSTYKLGADGNAEIALSWLELVIRTGYEPAYPDLERFLLNTGRWRLVETLFRELSRTESGRVLGEASTPRRSPVITPASGRLSSACFTRRPGRAEASVVRAVSDQSADDCEPEHGRARNYLQGAAEFHGPASFKRPLAERVPAGDCQGAHSTRHRS